MIKVIMGKMRITAYVHKKGNIHTPPFLYKDEHGDYYPAMLVFKEGVDFTISELVKAQLRQQFLINELTK